KTHDHALAARGGDGAHADVDDLAGDLLGDAAVLREALLGDVEAGFDLHAADDGGEEAAVRLLPLHELAVDAVAHDDLVADGLDVDVGRALPDRRVEEVVHPPDDGGL